MKAIGIDIGTTGICGVLMDAGSGEVSRTISTTSDAFIDTGREWERVQDVDKIIGIAENILKDLIESGMDGISSIGITGQMHGIVYINAEGNAVSNLYTWQDGRGNLPSDNGSYASEIGYPAGYGITTDHYNRKNGLVPEDAVCYCTIMDYLAMRLCGLKAPVIHSTNAASLGGYDRHSSTLLSAGAVTLTDDYTVIGKYCNIPVAVAIGDNQASVFATVRSSSSLLLNVGTGAQVSVISDSPVDSDEIESRPYFDGKYLLVGASLCGGRAYSMLRKFFEDTYRAAGFECKDVYSVMNSLAEGCGHTEIKVDTRFAGTRKNPDLRGAITGLSEESFTPAHLTLGVLNGIIDELYVMYESFGCKSAALVGSGNGLRRNGMLTKIAEDRFGGKMSFPTYREEAACGAALFAMVASGLYPDSTSVSKLIRYEGEC